LTVKKKPNRKEVPFNGEKPNQQRREGGKCLVLTEEDQPLKEEQDWDQKRKRLIRKKGTSQWNMGKRTRNQKRTRRPEKQEKPQA